MRCTEHLCECGFGDAEERAGEDGIVWYCKSPICIRDMSELCSCSYGFIWQGVVLMLLPFFSSSLKLIFNFMFSILRQWSVSIVFVIVIVVIASRTAVRKYIIDTNGSAIVSAWTRVIVASVNWFFSSSPWIFPNLFLTLSLSVALP